ncbi:hypothetical protein [Campylobacter sp. MG1]|uniref:hypothetical protein n=1 Tax=Campylobacter sp. MG1 TaxID=2976332 RepID=UPI00226D34AF|nr:hypothetical protein [Campylobacter sp. MG1]
MSIKNKFILFISISNGILIVICLYMFYCNTSNKKDYQKLLLETYNLEEKLKYYQNKDINNNLEIQKAFVLALKEKAKRQKLENEVYKEQIELENAMVQEQIDEMTNEIKLRQMNELTLN